MFAIINDVVQFAGELSDSWGSSLDHLIQVLEGFEEYGIGQTSEAIERYGPETRETTPTTRFLGGIYAIARLIPSFILVFFLLRYRFDVRRSFVIALLFELLSYLTLSVWLETQPRFSQSFELIAIGPTTLIDTIVEHFTSDPVDAFTVWVVILGTFIFISFVLWYSINFLLWGLTLMIKQRPLFHKSSAKGHALWMTITWMFFIAVTPAPTAFLNTLMVLLIIIVRRSISTTNDRSDPPRRGDPPQRREEDPNHPDPEPGDIYVRG